MSHQCQCTNQIHPSLYLLPISSEYASHSSFLSSPLSHTFSHCLFIPLSFPLSSTLCLLCRHTQLLPLLLVPQAESGLHVNLRRYTNTSMISRSWEISKQGKPSSHSWCFHGYFLQHACTPPSVSPVDWCLPRELGKTPICKCSACLRRHTLDYLDLNTPTIL